MLYDNLPCGVEHFYLITCCDFIELRSLKELKKYRLVIIKLIGQNKLLCLIKYHQQISLFVISEFKLINQLLFPLKSSENF